MAFQQMHSACSPDKWRVVRVVGKDMLHIPASSIRTVMVKGAKSMLHDGSHHFLTEPVKLPLPGGLMVVLYLVSSEKLLFPIPVVNLSPEDIWLQARTRLGTLSHVESVKSNGKCEMPDPRQVPWAKLDKERGVNIWPAVHTPSSFHSYKDNPFGYADRTHTPSITPEDPAQKPTDSLPGHQGENCTTMITSRGQQRTRSGTPNTLYSLLELFHILKYTLYYPLQYFHLSFLPRFFHYPTYLRIKWGALCSKCLIIFNSEAMLTAPLIWRQC
ncbi:uncharacterized protein LOC127423017 [Myxocyprinus asiaticus]|uniref:uncharacterized protein LOC127423017 n=1 Tax=Myxocyprinus asiaticus TaxID=70543 RepID=UPI002223A056|nr:uncharacterized protein LOC127423017 [Myxocyprinus asiaticus]